MRWRPQRKGLFFGAARQFTENLFHCSRCNYCVEASWEEKGLRHVCPTLLHHSPAIGYSGKGYLATARALADGEELSAATVADRIFACTTGGNCEEACPIGLAAGLNRSIRFDRQRIVPGPFAHRTVIQGEILVSELVQHEQIDRG